MSTTGNAMVLRCRKNLYNWYVKVNQASLKKLLTLEKMSEGYLFNKDITEVT